MTLPILTVLATAALAFANGANDVSKGVATLAGNGRASYRTALAWGTLWTFFGAAASLVISIGLVKAFTSAIVGSGVLGLPIFPLAVAAGATGWVVLASVTGLPVSTTHALTGAILGVAVVTGGVSAVSWWMALSAIAAPLALSPLVSAGIGYGMQAAAGRLSPTCVCVRDEVSITTVNEDGTMTARLAPQVVVSGSGCEAVEGQTRVSPAGILHWGAAAALSFARGVNDNPKLAAVALLGLPAAESGALAAFAVTAIAMTVGSYAAGLRVTRMLGERVVQMDDDTGLAAALVAAGLVLTASLYTLPVSTTHVATGAIVGAGVRQGEGAVDWRRVRSFVAAWIVSLPIAAGLAALAAWLFAGAV